MKHLTTLLAMVLCTSSFSQFVNVSSLTYDSLTVYNGTELYSATAVYNSNAVYHADIHFIWSTDKNDVSNRIGYDLQPVVMGPGVISHTEVYSLGSWDYVPLLGSDADGLYFGVYYDVVDDQGDIVQSYTSPARTWRFPSISTAVGEHSFTKKFSVYPSPAKTNFQIDGFDGMLVMSNLSGQTVLEKRVSSGEPIDVTSLAPGMYLLRNGESGVSLGRLVVE